MNRYAKSIVAALAVLLLAGGLFAVAGADNGLVTCPGPAYDTDCHKPDGSPVTEADINSGQWYRFNFAGEIYFGQPGLWADRVTDRNGNPFLSDAPAPGILMGLSSSGQRLHHGLYRGDTWKGQLNNAPRGPLTYRDNPGAVFRSNPNSAEDARIVYLADANNRVVRDDGEYYREERINGQWVRSVSYGSDDEAKDLAITSARNRSQGQGIAAAARVLFSGKLVSNTGKTRAGGTTLNQRETAQAFTTGSHGSGYKLTSVSIHLRQTGHLWPTLTLYIYSDSSGAPGTSLHTLTLSGSLTAGLNSFTASGGGFDLDADTTYWVFVHSAGVSSPTVSISRTASHNEDAGGATGWSLANSGIWRNRNVGDLTWINSTPRMIEIHGSEK